MNLFNVLELIGGLCLFLFGMDLMGQSLERRAGSALRSILGKLTNKKSAGFLTGLGVTAVIQSSSATTVMVVGFVNSGLMDVKNNDLNSHAYLRSFKQADEHFREAVKRYTEKYRLA